MGLLKLRKFEFEEEEGAASLELASWNSQGLLRFRVVEDASAFFAFASGFWEEEGMEEEGRLRDEVDPDAVGGLNMGAKFAELPEAGREVAEGGGLTVRGGWKGACKLLVLPLTAAVDTPVPLGRNLPELAELLPLVATGFELILPLKPSSFLLPVLLVAPVDVLFLAA